MLKAPCEGETFKKGGGKGSKPGWGWGEAKNIEHQKGIPDVHEAECFETQTLKSMCLIAHATKETCKQYITPLTDSYSSLLNVLTHL